MKPAKYFDINNHVHNMVDNLESPDKTPKGKIPLNFVIQFPILRKNTFKIH